MQTLTEIRSLLEARGIRPKHRLGQNFLHDHNQLRRIVDAAELDSGDLVLEVGPGTGTLTGELVAASAEVIACELDRDMASIVEERSEIASDSIVGIVSIAGVASPRRSSRRSVIVNSIWSRIFPTSPRRR